MYKTPSGLQLISKVSSTDITSDNGETTEPDTDEPRKFASVIGTMTHKLMEELVSSRCKIDCNSVIREIISEHRTAEMVPYEAEIIASLESVANTITNGGYAQINGLPQDILKTLLDADEVYCEVPFSFKDETEDSTVIWNGIMDVIYCSGGKWHIVDYKTNADGSDLDTEYQNQLNAYIKAFKEITGNDADAKTYHIDV
jgi:ATP-dependent exoDNAse (exonuclease V) beta subunit